MMRNQAVAQGNYMAAGQAGNNPYRFNQTPVVIGTAGQANPYQNINATGGVTIGGNSNAQNPYGAQQPTYNPYNV